MLFAPSRDINRCTVTFPITDAPVGKVAIEASAVVLSLFERRVNTDEFEFPSASNCEFADNVRTPSRF